MPEGAFNSGFEPVARKGDVIDTQPDYGYRLVERVNAQPRIAASQDNKDFSGIADGDQAQNEMTPLALDDNYLAQFRLPRLPDRLPDGVRIEVDHDSKNDPMYGQKNARGSWDNETGAVYSWDANAGNSVQDAQFTSFTELFIFEDNVPYLTIINDSGSQQSYDPIFTGYIYRTREIDPSTVRDENITPVDVPTSSI